jgi:hypothetical protein
MSERDIAEGSDISRRSLIRLRRIPYGAEESVSFSTTREIESVFDLPQGWMCITPEVRLGLGIEGGQRVPAGTAEGLRDQFPEWSLREGSKIMILLAQNTPLDVAREIVTE